LRGQKVATNIADHKQIMMYRVDQLYHYIPEKDMLNYIIEYNNMDLLKKQTIIEESYYILMISAVKYGHFNMAKYLHKNVTKKPLNPYPVIAAAAQSGNIAIIDWAASTFKEPINDNRILQAAIASQDEKIINYVYALGLEDDLNNCNNLLAAIEYNHVEFINKYYNAQRKFYNYHLKAAAKSTDLRVLEFIAKRIDVFETVLLFRYIMNEGNLVGLKYFIERGVDDAKYSTLYTASGKLDIIKYVFELYGTPDKESHRNILNDIIVADKLESLKYVIHNGVNPTSDAICAALIYRRYQMLMFLISVDCPMPISINQFCESIIGNIDTDFNQERILRYFIKSNNPYKTEFYNYAIERDNLPALKLLRATDCPWNIDSCDLVEHMIHKNTPMAKLISEWMRANNCPCNGKLH